MLPSGSSPLKRISDLIASTNPAPIALFVGVGIAVFVTLGVLQRTMFPTWTLANLDAEASIATWFAAALLWAAAIVWMLIALQERPRPIPVVGWAVLLAMLALDEGNAFHETLESLSGVDWQILYLPIMALGALAWLLLVNRLSPSPAATLLVAAGIAWGAVLALELIQNWGGEPVRADVYDPAMITEEGLEMIGSALVVLAGMATLRNEFQSA